ncbi:LAFA_0E08790g1_1 [Lachancea sp. 'fantastica']|nr:LAFA_0E08790g1_1 [Lachancea sp. 'fantastica']
MANKKAGKGHRKPQLAKNTPSNGGKTLLERIQMSRKVDNSKGRSKSPKDVGLRVVGGRLVSADDVGVLLREAAARTTPAPKAAKRTARKNGGNIVHNNKRVETTVQRREAARSRDRARVQPYGKDLYLTVNTSSESRFLRLRNLPLGSDSQSLAQAVERIAGVAVQKTSIVDLPSGSVTAELWLQSSDGRVLVEAQKRLDRANVNNRVISAEIVSS